MWSSDIIMKDHTISDDQSRHFFFNFSLDSYQLLKSEIRIEGFAKQGKLIMRKPNSTYTALAYCMLIKVWLQTMDLTVFGPWSFTHFFLRFSSLFITTIQSLQKWIYLIMFKHIFARLISVSSCNTHISSFLYTKVTSN